MPQNIWAYRSIICRINLLRINNFRGFSLMLPLFWELEFLTRFSILSFLFSLCLRQQRKEGESSKEHKRANLFRNLEKKKDLWDIWYLQSKWYVTFLLYKKCKNPSSLCWPWRRQSLDRLTARQVRIPFRRLCEGQGKLLHSASPFNLPQITWESELSILDWQSSSSVSVSLTQEEAL